MVTVPVSMPTVHTHRAGDAPPARARSARCRIAADPESALLWRLLPRLAVPGALLIAAVFAVHPLHVESVAWIIERKDLLSALFYLRAVLAWLRLVEPGRVGHYLLPALLFVAGLLSKSVMVTLPLALLLVQ